MSVVEKAIWIIERNTARDLTVDVIADGCDVSRSHLAAAFGATGTSAMKYLRGRRLSNAALALADGAPDILAVALDAGYGSHEAFTRAFRDQFGATPETVRDRRSLGGLKLVEPLKLSHTTRPRLNPPHIAKESVVRIVGLREDCSFDTTINVPAQWQRFVERMEEVENVLERMPIGISRAADEEGWFPYIAAVEVSSFGPIPRGLVKLEIPARTYAVFDHSAHVSTIYDTYAQIWNEALPASGYRAADAPILERHNPSFNPGTGEGGLTLWVPLADDAKG
jgi:AraC family transcriptional regulator